MITTLFKNIFASSFRHHYVLTFYDFSSESILILMSNHKEQQLGDTQFFAKANQEIRQICQQSIKAQALVRKIKKINALKDENNNKVIPPNIYLKYLVVDFLRSHNLNYSYSVFMKQCDILSAEVISRHDLVKTFSLETYYSQAPFNVSVIQLVLEKLACIDQQKIVKEFGVQIDLIKGDNTANSVLLKQVQVASIRKQVQQRQKKHYQSMLTNMKKQLSIMMKQDLKKQFDNKLKETRIQYQRQVNTLKEKNKQFLINNPKINPKVQQYIKQIAQLTNNNATTLVTLKTLQKEKISHNCFKVPKIVAKEKQLDEIKSQLLAKKQQYEFALKTLNTSVNNLAIQNQKINAPQKETDIFLEHIKNKKSTKEFMIDEIYRRMLVMDKRIESLSKDNEGLREINRLLTSKVAQYKVLTTQLRQKAELTCKTQQKLKIVNIKPPAKSIGIDVNAQILAQTFKETKKQNIIDAQQSEISESEEDNAVDRKTAMRLQVNSLHSQLQIYKNKLRYFVQDFQ